MLTLIIYNNKNTFFSTGNLKVNAGINLIILLTFYRHNLTSLKVLGSVGEPINPEAWLWYYRLIGEERCSIVDTFWQTETGGHVLTPLPGATPMKPGSAVSLFTVSEFPWKIYLRKLRNKLYRWRSWPKLRPGAAIRAPILNSEQVLTIFSKHPIVKNTPLKSEKVLKHNYLFPHHKTTVGPYYVFFEKETKLHGKRFFIQISYKI